MKQSISPLSKMCPHAFKTIFSVIFEPQLPVLLLNDLHEMKYYCEPDLQSRKLCFQSNPIIAFVSC